MFYETAGKFEVKDISSLREYLRGVSSEYYVYVLCYPPAAERVTPFYVGVGQGDRLFAHEREAATATLGGRKGHVIRQIQASGNQVLRYIDSIFSEAPWRREQQLIEIFGLLKDATGVLANEQHYAQSTIAAGVELRKYAPEGDALPSNFIRRNSRLVVGPRKPKSASSVYGKIYAVLETNTGVTGSELVELLLSVDFSNNDTVYSQGGQVSRPWLAKYIDGGFYKKNQYIAEL
jgi:hypothetical protein